MFNDYDLQDSFTTDELYLNSGEVNSVIADMGLESRDESFA